MSEIFTAGNLFTLLMLILLQAVLGFDNLLYISLESKKAPLKDQKKVRKIGILIAIVLRVVLLFLIVSLIGIVKEPISFLTGHLGEFAHFAFNGHSIIVLIGGGFIVYTAIKEIWHLIANNNLDGVKTNTRTKKTTNAVVVSIVIMNLVFSFDSILAAIGLTNEIGNYATEMIIMSIAIVISGLIMLLLADKVSEFLNKNRMYEVLGLFILFIVGIMLVTEGGHLAHLEFFGNKVEPMNNTTFYFIIAILVIVDVVQGKYQKRIIAQEKEENQK